MRRPPALLYAFAALAATATAEESASPPMRDAATHDQLVLQLRTAQRDDPMKQLQPANAPDPAVANPPKDLISDSDILCFGGLATLVPKRAILNIPKNVEDRLQYQTGSKILSWRDFYAQNRGWITTVEVTRIQAEGNEPLAKDIAERVQTSPNLVIATYQSGPISVLPPKEPPAAKPAEEASAKTTDTPPVTATPTNKNLP